METLGALKEALADYLRAAFTGELAEVRFVGEFSGDPRAFPLRRPVIAVGVEQVALAESGFGGYLGEGESASLHGRAAEITVRFDIHCPPARGGARCHELYEALCDALLLRADPFGFLRLGCGEIAFDKESDANRMRAAGVLRAAVARRDGGPIVRDFEIRSDLIHDNR